VNLVGFFRLEAPPALSAILSASRLVGFFFVLQSLISPDALEIALGAGGAFCFMESRR
jgi:hypothetical protein